MKDLAEGSKSPLPIRSSSVRAGATPTSARSFTHVGIRRHQVPLQREVAHTLQDEQAASTIALSPPSDIPIRAKQLRGRRRRPQPRDFEADSLLLPQRLDLGSRQAHAPPVPVSAARRIASAPDTTRTPQPAAHLQLKARRLHRDQPERNGRAEDPVAHRRGYRWMLAPIGRSRAVADLLFPSHPSRRARGSEGQDRSQRPLPLGGSRLGGLPAGAGLPNRARSRKGADFPARVAASRRTASSRSLKQVARPCGSAPVQYPSAGSGRGYDRARRGRIGASQQRPRPGSSRRIEGGELGHSGAREKFGSPVAISSEHRCRSENSVGALVDRDTPELFQ